MRLAFLSGTPDDEDVGVYEIVFSVEDAAGAVSTSDPVTLTVNNVNDPVYIDEGQSASFKADKEGVYQIAISDEDLADSYTFTADDLPDWLSLDPATGILTGTPTRADDGAYEINITVTDEGGLSDNGIINLKSTSYQYATLGSGSDVFIGESVQDHVSTGGGDDFINTGAGDDLIVVEAAYASHETVTLTVTVEKGEDGAEKFFINGAESPELGIVTGQTYIFDLSDPSLTGSPFSIGIFGDGEGEEPSYEVEEEYAGRYALLPGEHINRYGEEGQEGAYVSVEIPHNFNEYFWNTLYYYNHTVAGMGGYTSTTVGSSSPDNVEVDTGEGDDRVIVEDGWSGTLLLKNGAGFNVLELLGDYEDIEAVSEDGGTTITNGESENVIQIEGQHFLNGDTGLVEIADTGFQFIKFYGHSSDGVIQDYATYVVVGNDDANYLIANQPDDAEEQDEVFVFSGAGSDVIEVNAANGIVEGGLGDDVIYINAVAGDKMVFGDIFLGDDGGVRSTNTNYADKVYIDWVYDSESIAEISGTNGQGVVVWNDDLGARVEIYDAEELIFRTVDGDWDAGISIGETAVVGTGTDPDDPLSWKNGHHGKSFSYSDDNIRFVLTDKPAADGGGDAPSASPNGDATSDWLQVYATATRQEAYTVTTGSGRKKKTVTKYRNVEEEALIWEGDRTAVGKFAFEDTDIQVINVQEQDAFGDPILYTTGSDKTDLIFGNQYANIIDGGGGDDIIFGGGGDDVLIGGEGDDVITGGEGDDIIRGDGIDTDDVAYEEIEAMAEDLAELSADEDPNITLSKFSVGTGNDGNDTILGGDGVDDIDSGDGENFVSSGRLELETEGETDLETLRDHIKSHKDIFDDDDWI
jgi:Ca2+-binding RTX toxin-like protein